MRMCVKINLVDHSKGEFGLSHLFERNSSGGQTYMSYVHSKVKLVWIHCRKVTKDTHLWCLWKEQRKCLKATNFEIPSGQTSISTGHFKLKLVWAHCGEIVKDTTLWCPLLKGAPKMFLAVLF